MLSMVIVVMGLTDAAKPWCSNFAVMMVVNVIGAVASGGLDVGKNIVKDLKFCKTVKNGIFELELIFQRKLHRSVKVF